MALLRRVLYAQAALATLTGVALVLLPRFLLVTLMGQPAYVDYTWVRIAGIQAFTLSLLAVLVIRRIEELWWWAWAYVLVAFGTAAATTLHALIGLPAGAEAWPWWAAGLASWLITFGLLRGIAKAGLDAQSG